MNSGRRSLLVLTLVLMAELLVLAWQVHRNRDISIVRQGSMLVTTPISRALRTVADGTWGVWRGYVDLRGARRENQQLARQLDSLKLEYQRLQDEAAQGRRLQVLLDFKQRVPSETVAAQVISSGANDNSRLVVIDKGEQAGVRPDMAVVVPDGIIGKVLRTFPYSAQVLLLTDSNSGVACVLESSRIHGILKGQNKNLAMLSYVVNDDKIQIGERVFTSGEDQIYPKGMPVGVVVEARPGASFQGIVVQPFAKMNRLEEVLVVTKKTDVELPIVPTAGGRTVAGVSSPSPANPQSVSASAKPLFVAAPRKPAAVAPAADPPRTTQPPLYGPPAPPAAAGPR
ncbi:MAG: rod shape-determining protein MreC [Acidobacteria bacterium]|nr:rod shape-determining protein MreC [Acidobacteriota bacterium]